MQVGKNELREMARSDLSTAQALTPNFKTFQSECFPKYQLLLAGKPKRKKKIALCIVPVGYRGKGFFSRVTEKGNLAGFFFTVTVL